MAQRFVEGESFSVFTSLRHMLQKFVDCDFSAGPGLELREMFWAKCDAFDPGGCDCIPHFSLTCCEVAGIRYTARAL